MGEPIRGYIEVHGEGSHSMRNIRAREDRATEADIEAVAELLMELKLELQHYPKAAETTARGLLALVFGGEPSDV